MPAASLLAVFDNDDGSFPLPLPLRSAIPVTGPSKPVHMQVAPFWPVGVNINANKVRCDTLPPKDFFLAGCHI